MYFPFGFLYHHGDSLLGHPFSNLGNPSSKACFQRFLYVFATFFFTCAAPRVFGRPRSLAGWFHTDCGGGRRESAEQDDSSQSRSSSFVAFVRHHSSRSLMHRLTNAVIASQSQCLIESTVAHTPLHRPPPIPPSRVTNHTHCGAAHATHHAHIAHAVVIAHCTLHMHFHCSSHIFMIFE